MLRLENEALFNKGCNRNFFPTSIGYAFIIKKGQIRSEQESLVTLFETHCSMMCDSKTCRIPFRVEIYLFIYLQEIANDKWNQMSSWKKKIVYQYLVKFSVALWTKSRCFMRDIRGVYQFPASININICCHVDRETRRL